MCVLKYFFAFPQQSHTEQCQLTSLATAHLCWQINKRSICFMCIFCWCGWSFAFAVFNMLSLKTDVQNWAFLFADIRRCSAATPLPSFDNTITILLLLDELQSTLNYPLVPLGLWLCTCVCAWWQKGSWRSPQGSKRSNGTTVVMTQTTLLLANTSKTSCAGYKPDRWQTPVGIQ